MEKNKLINVNILILAGVVGPSLPPTFKILISTFIQEFFFNFQLPSLPRQKAIAIHKENKEAV